MNALFLNPPSYAGFDGGAGARYQARREIRSFWYPTWLAYPAGLVKESRLIDAPAAGLSLEAVVIAARDYDLVIFHTSTPSLRNDIKVAERLKAERSGVVIGFVGPHTMVQPEATLHCSNVIDFVTTGEFDYAPSEIVQGKRMDDIPGICFRKNGNLIRTQPLPPIHDLDALPFVSEVYARNLRIEDYFIGYLQHPYVSLYTGRGCRSKCSFCLWPQTIGGHIYRTRSVENVCQEMKLAKQLFPQVKEFFFDDDTFTDDLPRAEETARHLARLGICWSCNAKANVPRQTLEILKENGLRLLLVGFESGNQQILNNIRKGTRIDRAKEFMRHCKDLGILVHGTFILGLPGETHETIEETIRFAQEIDPYSIQVSLAAPYPGTELYAQAMQNGWLLQDEAALVNDGIQDSVLSYASLDKEAIYEALERFYRRFYFRPRPVLRILRDMISDRQVMLRRLREGREFFSFMATRRRSEACAPTELSSARNRSEA